MYSYKRTALSVEVNKATKMLLIALSAMLVSVSVYFFIYMSINAEKGSLVRENQLHQKSLESENRLLKEQVLQSQSLDTIQSSNEVEGMKPSTDETYVSPPLPIGSRNGETQQIID